MGKAQRKAMLKLERRQKAYDCQNAAFQKANKRPGSQKK